MKKRKVEFLKSPTGKYGLAYNKGEQVELDPELALAMFKDKTAIPAEEADKQRDEAKKAEDSKKKAESKKTTTKK